MTSTQAWIAALDTSSERLRKTVIDLPTDTLDRPSFAGGWSISQVLSHLGSAAEICTKLVQRGIGGDTNGPSAEDVQPVWQRWNAMPSTTQREAWLEADRRHRDLLLSLDAQQLDSTRVPYFAGLLSVAEYAGYRLSEHVLHAWDIEVALDPSAGLPRGETDLLWQRLDLVVTRFRNADTLARLAPKELTVELTDRGRTHGLSVGTELHLSESAPALPDGTISGPADALLRLVYGRYRAQDDVTVRGQVTLADLQELFPGF
ncbi:maleylpyruvate isomerase family mycothiol-dependent enzyme [Amycolatopsis sp. NPDC005232]|uniref:maleylpyruvate isomerase family mycothiol-dependent enzyme n=1 Tax=Amycolatopsis sp. NPDC005232 TaxID=3157027 RepID=UPI0033AC21B3